MAVPLASLSRFMLWIFCFTGFLNLLYANTALLFREDPEFLQLNLDSVATGNIRFQIRTGSDYPYSHRANITLTPAFSFRTCGQAGFEKSRNTSSIHFKANKISLGAGPVLISHARGWIVGKATARRSLYPGNTELKQSIALRKGPYTHSPYSGYASVNLQKLSATFFLSEKGWGASLEIRYPNHTMALYHSPDQWQESMIQICGKHFLAQSNISYHWYDKQWGHACGNLTIKGKRTRVIFLAYTTSTGFNPHYGKHPWFGGDEGGCTGFGWGLSISSRAGHLLKTSLLQQIRTDGYDRKTELYLSSHIGNMKSETLLRLISEQTIGESSTFPALLTYIKNHLFTFKQAFILPITSRVELQNIWLVSTDFHQPASAGIVLITLKHHKTTLKIQFSQIMGGSSDMWYTRLYCGKQPVIQKAGKENLSTLDITCYHPVHTVRTGFGFSISREDIRAVVQLQIALDSMNR
ncbi:MAG: hypothetical protein ACP5D8_01050 [Fidelibacterota bacterium]